jgi:putative effector of murein hydrolase
VHREILALGLPPQDAPLVWIVVTIAAYLGGRWLQRRLGGTPLINPVLLAIVFVSCLLFATGTSYRAYFQGAQFINFLLGPAIVALAVPLARNLHHVRRSLNGIGLALLAGSLTSIVGGIALVWLLGGTRNVVLSMAPKAATTPIAMAVSSQIGGEPALTAALAIVGGIVAASIGQRLLMGMRIADSRAHGLAAGVAGSGIAAAQVASLDGLAATFAALGMAFNGLITALLLPIILLPWR